MERYIIAYIQVEKMNTFVRNGSIGKKKNPQNTVYLLFMQNINTEEPRYNDSICLRRFCR